MYRNVSMSNFEKASRAETAFSRAPGYLRPLVKQGKTRPLFTPNPSARLMDQVREVLRFHHYALRTEEAYVQWIKRFLIFWRDDAHRATLQGDAHRATLQGDAHRATLQETKWRHPR